MGHWEAHCSWRAVVPDGISRGRPPYTSMFRRDIEVDVNIEMEVLY